MKDLSNQQERWHIRRSRIIPRGAENTPAIDLISQHLKFGLIQRLSGKNADLVSDNLVSTSSIKISMDDMFGDSNEKLDNLQLLDEKESKKERKRNKKR